MFKCKLCEVPHKDGAQCSGCLGHFDFACAGITESGYRRLGKGRRGNWKCSSCKASVSASPSWPDKNVPTSSSLADVDNIMSELQKLSSQMTTLPTLLENVRTIQAELKELKCIKTDITDMKNSLEFVHDLVKNLTDRIAEVDKEVQILKKSKDEISELHKRVNKLEQDLREGEQRSRINNIEIKGVPSTTSENLFSVISKIGEVTKCNISKEQINYIARIPTRNDQGNKSIIVSLHNRYVKENFVAAARKCDVITPTQLGLKVLAIPIIPLSFSHYLPALGIYWNSWRTVVVMYSIPAVITAIWLFFMQESPKFVFTKGDEERTLEILRAIHKVNHLFSAGEYSVKRIQQEHIEKKEGTSSVKDQIVPLFKQPLLKYTILVTLLLVFQQVGAFGVWLPTIANQFVRIIETGEGSDLTLCGVIGASMNAPVDPDETPCALNVTSLLFVLVVGLLQSAVNTLLTLVVNKAGRRNMVMVVTSICGVAGILVNFIPNAIGSAVMFAVLLLGIIVFGLYTAIIVALFPTNVRAMAIALPITGGRIVTFASIQILNLMLANNCEAGFYVFSSIFACSAIVAFFLPDDRRLMQRAVIPPKKNEEQLENQQPRDITEL